MALVLDPFTAGPPARQFPTQPRVRLPPPPILTTSAPAALNSARPLSAASHHRLQSAYVQHIRHPLAVDDRPFARAIVSIYQSRNVNQSGITRNHLCPAHLGLTPLKNSRAAPGVAFSRGQRIRRSHPGDGRSFLLVGPRLPPRPNKMRSLFSSGGCCRARVRPASWSCALLAAAPTPLPRQSVNVGPEALHASASR
jgi:hypothetical protein